LPKPGRSRCWSYGGRAATSRCHIENQYEENYEEGHELSVDATMMIVIEDPLSEPAIHRCFPGGLEDLEEYRLEFVEGIKDHWVRHPDEPGYSGEWTYTYSQRFTKYYSQRFTKYECNVRHIEQIPHGEKTLVEQQTVNQVEHAVASLAKSPHSRRVKLVTWQPWIDMFTDDPPCLGEFWLRCSQHPSFDGYILNGNAIFRSRDSFDAAFMNLWGEVEFMVKTAGQLQAKLGKPVRVGRLCDLSHSYHIYGKAVQRFKELFLGGVEKKSWEDRTWTREFAQPLFDEARPKIMAKIRKKDANA
jgi:thymidylate synthase